MTKLYVHGRLPHADDLLAAATVLSKNDIEEIIRDDEHLEMADEHDFIVDCGRVHDGVTKFDHHQMKAIDKTVGTPCAATLTARKFTPWVFDDPRYGSAYEEVRVLDTMGPDAHEAKYGPQWNIFQEAMVRLFGENPMVAARILADTILDREYVGLKMPVYLEWLKANAIVDDDVLLVGNPWKAFADKRDIKGLIEAVGYIAKDKGCIATVTWDQFDQCWSLFLTYKGQCKGFDLYKSNPKELKFKHAEGFLCKYVGEMNEWRDLLEQARPE